MELILMKKQGIKHQNMYMVECEAMFGDADGEGQVNIGGFVRGQDEALIEDLLKTCERLVKAYPNGRGGSADYNHIDGFNRWFDADALPEEEYDALSEVHQNFIADWLYEPNGMGQQATFKGYKVYYYDENGVKHDVRIKW